MIFYFIIVAFATVGSAIDCYTGVPILTRIPNEIGSYTVAFQCLCPIDSFGMQCRNHRRIQCYLTTKDYEPKFVDSSNFETQKQFNVTFQAQCFLQESNRKFISFVNYFIRNQTQKQNYQWQLQSGSNGGEIIWANNTNLLTQSGMVRYQEGYNFTQDQSGTKRMSKTDEQKVLYGDGPYKFQYKSSFLGFPLTNSNFYVTSNIYKFLENHHELPRQNLSFINIENYTSILNEAVSKQEQAKEYYEKFSIKDFDFSKLDFADLYQKITDLGKEVQKISTVDVVPEIRATIKVNLSEETQFGILKAEFKIEEYYNEYFKQKTSINSAIARIPIRVQVGSGASNYNPNFYTKPSRIIYVIIGLVILAGLYGVYKFYKRHRLAKLKKIQLKVQQQFEASELQR